MPEVSEAATMKRLTIRELGIVLFARRDLDDSLVALGAKLSKTYQLGATPRSAISSCAARARRENRRMHSVPQRGGQIQANDQDIVLATFSSTASAETSSTGASGRAFPDAIFGNFKTTISKVNTDRIWYVRIL